MKLWDTEVIIQTLRKEKKRTLPPDYEGGLATMLPTWVRLPDGSEVHPESKAAKEFLGEEYVPPRTRKIRTKARWPKKETGKRRKRNNKKKKFGR